MARTKTQQLPTSISVMGVPFRIDWNHKFDDATDLGETSGPDRVIRIASHTGRRSELASTFLHELIHAVLYVSGLEDTLDRQQKDLDETVTHVLEHGLYPLLGAVGDVAKYVQREGRRQ